MLRCNKTRSYALNQWWFNVGPPSTTLANNTPILVKCSKFVESMTYPSKGCSSKNPAPCEKIPQPLLEILIIGLPHGPNFPIFIAPQSVEYPPGSYSLLSVTTISVIRDAPLDIWGGGGRVFVGCKLFFASTIFFCDERPNNFFYENKISFFLSCAFPIIYVTIWCFFWSTYFSSISTTNFLFLSTFSTIFFSDFFGVEPKLVYHCVFVCLLGSAQTGCLSDNFDWEFNGALASWTVPIPDCKLFSTSLFQPRILEHKDIQLSPLLRPDVACAWVYSFLLLPSD